MISFNCDDKQTLIAYLYDEVDAATRARVDAHLAACPRCAAEVRALGDVRLELSQWAPPDAELGFAVVRRSEHPAAQVLRPVRWWQTVPAWAQVAAAIFVLAAGASIANIQVRSSADGFVVTTGWMSPPQPALSAPSEREAIGREVEALRTELASLEQQLRNEIRSSRPVDAVRASAGPVDEATVRRVRQLLEASEHRQQRELAFRFAQFASEMDVLRRADAQRMTRGLVQFDEQMFRQQQLLNNIVRISGTPQQ